MLSRAKYTAWLAPIIIFGAAAAMALYVLNDTGRDPQVIGYCDEPMWLLAGNKLCALVRQGDFSSDAWWFYDTAHFGNLNQPLPKLAIAAVYNLGLDLTSAITGREYEPWSTPWNFAHTDNNASNFYHAALRGIHAFWGRLLPVLLGGVAAWLMFLLLRHTQVWLALAATAIFVFHPLVLRTGGILLIDSWYWVFLLASTLALVRLVAAPTRWYTSAALYGLCIGLAATSKLVGFLLGLLILVGVGETLLRQLRLRRRVLGYCLALCASLLIIYGTNPAFWPDFSHMSEVPGELNRFREEVGLRELLTAAGTIHGDNRQTAVEQYPALYNAFGRPLEFPATFLRFRTLMETQASRHDWLRAEGNRTVPMRLLELGWFLIPFAIAGFRAAWKMPDARARVIALTTAVHIVFLQLTIVSAAERYFIPALMYLTLMAGLGAHYVFSICKTPALHAEETRCRVDSLEERREI